MNRSSGKMARLAPVLGFVGLAVLLIAGFTAVLEKRFESGELYPHYSTLRSDPLGAKALHDSLTSLDGLEVSRNVKSLMSIDHLDGDTTLWLCGLSRASFERLRAPEDSPVLRAVEDDGARLVITLNPRAVPEKFDLAEEEELTDFEEWWEERERIQRQKKGDEEEESEEKEDADSDADETEEKKQKEKSREEWEIEFEESNGEPLTQLLGLEVEIPDEFERPDEGWELAAADAPITAALPETLPNWRSHHRFAELGGEWKVAATIDDEPVLIERSLGAGTVVLASDSYFASNEALWRGASPDFLLWLTGAKPRLVFDETIHGTVETGGTMKIIRRYRFHGFFFGLAIFVALLAWKSGSSLSPGSEEIERGIIGEGDSIAGEETGAGMLRLLRRNVPQPQLLRTCLQVWRESSGQRHRAENDGQRSAIEEIVSAHESDPKEVPITEAFRRISYILSNPDEFQRPNRA